MKKIVLLFVVLCMLLVCNGFNVSCEEVGADWRTAVVAKCTEKKITGEEFARFLTVLGYQEDRDRLINLEIVRQEKAATGTVVTPEEIDAAYKEYIDELLKEGEAKNETELLYLHRMTVDDVRDSIGIRLSLMKMVMKEMKISEENVTNAIPLWFEKKRNAARVIRFSLKHDQPFENCAAINDKNIPVLDLIVEILKRKSDSEIADFMQELLDYFILQHHLASNGEMITKEDLLDEFDKLRDEVAEDPQFNGVGLIDLLAAQKKSIEDLMSEPGFILRAYVRKAFDLKREFSVDEQRAHYNAHKLDFCERQVLIRIISVYYRETDGTPRAGVTRETVAEKASEIKKRIDAGESFETLAEQYAEDPGLKKTKGLVGTPLKQASTIFQFLPQLLSVFKGAQGEILGPIETDFGSHIVKIEKVEDKSFEQVQGKVLEALRRAYRQERLTALRKQYEPEHIGAHGILKLFKPKLVFPAAD